MQFVDTHCHVHFDELLPDADGVLGRARAAGVTKMVCVGVSLGDSKKAAEFAAQHHNIWATAGVHPHEAKDFTSSSAGELRKLLNSPKIVAVGEVGLDYYKLYSGKDDQQAALRAQIEVGQEVGLPFVFHVREAWSNFWPIFDEYKPSRGVIHSFTGGSKQLDQALSRNLFVALNGIITYTRDEALLQVAKKVPLDKLVLETDAPFLTPAADKGKTCEPKHTRMTAEFLAKLRNEDLAEIAAATTKNAAGLFGLK